MTRLQIIELFKEHHPNLTGRQFDLILENAGNQIISVTGGRKTTYMIDSEAGKRWYDLTDGIERIQKVYFNDVEIPRLIGEPLIDDDEFYGGGFNDAADEALPVPTANVSNKRFWMLSQWNKTGTYSTPRLGIVEKATKSVTRDGRTSDYQSCSITGTNNIRVLAITAAFTENSTVESESDGGSYDHVGPLASVPAQYHEVLLNGAISLGYKNPRNLDLDLATFYENEFQKGIKRVKKYERTKTSVGFIRPQDF